MSGGLFHRLEQILEVICGLPDELSDAEVEGLGEVLPPDTARAIRAVMSPHVRSVSLPFLQHTGRWLADVRQAKAGGRKVILIPFNFPPEVIRVFKGAVPLTCEVLTTLGVATLEGQGGRYWDKAMELGIPDFLCSSSTVALGSLMSGDDFQPDAIVQSTAGACDANSKIHEFAALQMDLPQFFVERPTDSSPRGREQHWRYFSRFMGELQEFIGEELDEEHMRAVLEHSNRAAEQYYDLYDLHRFAPCPVPNLFALYSYSVRFSLWGTPEATELMGAMVRVSEDRRQRGEYPAPREIARCIWLYVGYYFDLYGLFNWMEERGISYLQDALSLYYPRHVDTSSVERMLRGLALGASDYPMTRQMGADSMTVAWREEAGCFFKLNAFLRAAIESLAARFDLCLVDAEAGVEQVNRRVMRSVTHLLLVSDTSRKSLAVARTIHQVAGEAVAHARVGLVLNRLRPGDDAHALARDTNLPLLGALPEDDTVRRFDQQARPFFEINQSPALEAVRQLLRDGFLTPERQGDGADI